MNNPGSSSSKRVQDRTERLNKNCFCVTLDLPSLREALEQGRQVKLSGFGNFDLRRKNQRPGRNPKTGEEIPISARTVVTFRPGQKLKERVEAYSSYSSAGAAHA